ncbi:MAG TPA: methyltransferase, partial [Candidatus Angelobacter sp.]|nr:methyltransferase [Candidatus Angelobacter sp.]
MNGPSAPPEGSRSTSGRVAPTEAAHPFDQHADVYDAELNQALSLTGETKEYFATQRVKWLARCLRRLQEQPRSAMDFGCGIGDTCVLLRQAFNLDTVLGLDVSCRSLEVAGQKHASAHCSFLEFQNYVPQAAIDLVYCNGVFHHIPVAEREESVDYIRRSLRPDGLLAFWENNPWNPGTRYVMSKLAFDGDANTLTPPEALRLLRRGGFEIISLHYRFIFPRFLKWFRFVEPCASRLPLGAQYQILCRKPLQC